MDKELGGFQRLEGLVPALPTLPETQRLDDEALMKRCRITAAAARQLGVSMFLAPIADVIDGQNP